MARARPGATPKPSSNEPNRFAPTRIAWVKAHVYEMVIHKGNSEDPDDLKYHLDPEIGDPVRLVLRVPRARPIIMYLTSLTVAELDALQTFFNKAIDLARPIAAKLDAQAQQAFEEGDDSYSRIYRAVPEIVERQRKVGQHGTSVPSGPDGAQSLADGGLDGQHRASSDGVPDDVQEGVGTLDNEP